MKLKQSFKKMTAVFLTGVMLLSMPGGHVGSVTVGAASNKKTTISFKKPGEDTKILVLKKGQSYKLKTKVISSVKVSKKLTYKSSKSSVVSVSTTGKLKARKKGSATITVALKASPKIKAKLKVKVGTKVKKVTLNSTNVTLEPGTSYMLKAALSPKKPTVKSVVYKSSNTSVATVDKKGRITAVAEGVAKITVKAQDGTGKKAVCTVTVKQTNQNNNNVQPGTTENPGDGQQTGTTEQVGTTQQPDITVKPGTTEKPEDGGQTGTTEKPEDGEQTGTTEKSEDGGQTGTTEKPEDGEQTGTTEKPEDDGQSGTTEKPEDDGQTGTTEKPENGEQTGTTEKSEDDGQSGTTEQPGDNEQPGATETPVEKPELDDVEIPTAGSNSALVGATMPYTRYDSTTATLGGGATLKTSADFAEMNIATQASEQSYVELPSSGAYAEWTMNTTGNGVTMRFTLPDSSDGKGQDGSLDVYVNGNKVKTIDLTSYYMWQYFASGHPSDTNDGGVPAFAFDETHFRLDASLKAGDKIRIQSSGANNLTYGVDFLEIEETGEAILQPANSYSVVDYGAIPDDGIDDLAAIQACTADADADGKDVYFPEGTYHINEIWRLYGSDMMITGAGMWYTNIQFTNDQAGMGGISGGWSSQGGSAQDGYCKNVEFCNMYINSNLRSRYNQQAVYKCFMDIWTGAVIHDIWEEHFECGFWFGDYNGNMDYCDDALIMNCRIRNNLADGVNFCQGTSSATVYNCNIRNNGDDGLAMWNDSTMGAKDETNNTFCYNTIEMIWRAGGIAIYGGSGHKVYNNYIADTFMAAGIHLNTTFPGHKFTNNTGIEFTDNVIVRSGTSADCWDEEFGAVDIKGEVKNVTFTNTSIYDAQHEGIRIFDNPTGITFKNTKVYGAGVDGKTASYSAVAHKGAVLRFSSDTSSVPVTFDNFEYANIAYEQNDGVFGSLSSCTVNGWKNLGNNYSYTIPEGGKVGSLNTDHREGGSYIETKPSTGVGGSTGGNNGGTTTPANGCDLIITSIELIPADAKVGDEVAIKVTVQNQGNEASPAGTKHGLAVSVGSKNYSAPTIWCDTHFDSIPAGGTATLTTNGGSAGKATWTAATGNFTVYAIIDDQSLIIERNEMNNEASLIGTFTADGNTISRVNVTDSDQDTSDGNSGGESDNGSNNESDDESGSDSGNNENDNSGNNSGNNQGGTSGNTQTVAGVTATSSHSLYPATHVNDGDTSTYWEGGSANASLTMNLGGIQSVNKITLKLNPDSAWSARTQKVEVQTSLDGTSYTTVAAVRTVSFDPASGNAAEISFDDVTARYIKVNMSENTGASAPQLAELEVSGNPDIKPEYPDLTVEVSATPNPATIGESATLKAVIKNEGGAAVASGTDVKVVFTVGDETFEKTYSQGIDVNAVAEVTQSWTANTTGEIAISAEVDTDNTIIELNEGNNAGEAMLKANPVAGPDLVIDGLSIAPGSPSAGDEVTLQARVTNDGNEATKAGNLVVEAVVTKDDGTSMTLVSAPYTQAIAAGDTVTIELKQTASGSKWIAEDTGYKVAATVDTTKVSGEDSRNAANNNANANYFFGRGASMPFTVMEAEDAKTNGTVLEKNFLMADYAGEASGRSAVQLDTVGEYVEFTLTAPANAFVLRSGLADNTNGTISLYIDGKDTADFNVTSKFSHVYTTPSDLGQLGYKNSGDTAYWLYEDAQLLLDTTYPAGSKVRIQKDNGDVSQIYVDMIEAEEVAPAKTNPNPEQYVEVSASKDISTALNEARMNKKKGIFIPAGEWTLSSKLQVYGGAMEILGAGPWHTKLVAPQDQENTDMGFRIAEDASGTILKDFSAWGNYVYRIDGPGKFIDGDKMTNVTVENIWAEHFICLYWGVGACNNTFKDCRIKNVFADGINMTNGSNNNVITNCYARATGDDSFALFSATDNGGSYNTGNEYSNLTAVCPRRAACFAIYGGSDNTYTNLYGADTQTYPGLTISSLSFGYQTLGFGDQECLVEGVTLDRCGGDFWGNNGSDEGDKFNDYQNFGAIWMYAGDRILQNVTLRNIDINEPVYYGIQIQSMYSGSPASDPMENIIFENISINNPARYGIKFLVCAESGQGPCVGSATFKNVNVTNPGLGLVYGLDRCPDFTATIENCNWN